MFGVYLRRQVQSTRVATLCAASFFLSRLERLGVDGFRVGGASVGGQGPERISRCVRRVMSQPIPLNSSSLALFFLTSVLATLTQSSTGTPQVDVKQFEKTQRVRFIVTPSRLVSLVAVSASDLLGGEPAPGPSPAGIAAELLRQWPGRVGDA